MTGSKTESSSQAPPISLDNVDLGKVPYLPLACYTYKSSRRLHKQRVVDRAVLEDIVKNLPVKVYKTQWRWVVGSIAAVIVCSVGAVCVLSMLPWYLTPLGWILASFALTGCFSIGHDCAHGNWTDVKWLNKIAGELSFLPLMHPFESWCFWHAQECEAIGSGLETIAASPAASVSPGHSSDCKTPTHSAEAPPKPVTHESPMSYLASWGVKTYFLRHYNAANFPKQIRGRVRASIAFSCIFFALFFPWVTLKHGLLGPVHFWVIPLVLYKDFVFERWLEFKRRGLHGLDMYLPAPFATAIASYNLATASRYIHQALDKLQQNVGASPAVTVEQKRADVGDSEWTKKPLIQRLNWVNCAILLGTPFVTIYGMFTTPMTANTFVFSIIYYFFTGLGITAGYHRLWSHRAYSAGLPVRIFLLLGGTGALEGSIKWWCGGHRSHHRYTDSYRDPYNAKQGFFYAHMGWMLVKPDPKLFAKADIRDLQADPLIRFQHAHYGWFGPFMAFVAPTLIAGLGWGDWRGGYFYAGALRLLFVHHSTFCVNSLAHFFGSHTYDDTRTPRDHYFTAIVTLGEGYHNFHHEFPNDYRNGIRFFDYDPTKWLIKGLSLFGLTFNLKEFPANEVQKGKLHMKIKKLDKQKDNLVYPGPVDELPAWSFNQFKQQSKVHRGLVIIDGIVHDVKAFVPEHPGGDIIKPYLGTDATHHFNGSSKIYAHSTAARHLLSSFRVARIVGPVVASNGPEVPALDLDHDHSD